MCIPGHLPHLSALNSTETDHARAKSPLLLLCLQPLAHDTSLSACHSCKAHKSVSIFWLQPLTLFLHSQEQPVRVDIATYELNRHKGSPFRATADYWNHCRHEDRKT
jgi:hypothetical protein